jgi:hypothetical protein
MTNRFPKPEEILLRVNRASPFLRACLLLAGFGGGYALVRADVMGSPVCPFHTMTGLSCPGCGLTRGILALLRGDLVPALAMNLFSPVFLGVLLWTAVGWVWGSSRFISVWRRLPLWVQGTTATALVTFGVVRNIPGFEFLQPT